MSSSIQCSFQQQRMLVHVRKLIQNKQQVNFNQLSNEKINLRPSLVFFFPRFPSALLSRLVGWCLIWDHTGSNKTQAQFISYYFIRSGRVIQTPFINETNEKKNSWIDASLMKESFLLSSSSRSEAIEAVNSIKNCLFEANVIVCVCVSTGIVCAFKIRKVSFNYFNLIQ